MKQAIQKKEAELEIEKAMIDHPNHHESGYKSNERTTKLETDMNESLPLKLFNPENSGSTIEVNLEFRESVEVKEF